MTSIPRDYTSFLASKTLTSPSVGFTVDESTINPQLFDFQRDLVRWSLRKGRSALFAGTGLGKTPMQLVWADHVARQTRGAEC